MGLDKFNPETNTFTHYRHNANDPESLSNDSVTAVLVDHLGNIWVGNYGGVDLLDPKTGKFKHYRHTQDPSSLSSRMVRAMYEDREGTLWIGTGFFLDNDRSDGGLNRFDRKTGTFIRYMHDPNNPHSLIDNRVRAIFEDSKGNFWIGTTGDGLHTMDRKAGSFERHLYEPSKPDQLARPPVNSVYDHITFITEDAKQNLWIGTIWNGLTRYDPATKKITHYGNNADGSGNYIDNTAWWANASADGLFWVSTQASNLYMIDLKTTIPYYSTEGLAGNAFYLDPKSNILWIGTDVGLARKDMSNGSLKIWRHDSLNTNSLAGDSINAMRVDAQGKFWMATKNGLSKFDPLTNNFTNWRHKEGDANSLSSNLLLNLCIDHNKNLWIATVTGLDMLDAKTGKFTNYRNNPNDSNSLSNNVVRCIAEDQNNELWAGTNGGINRLDVNSMKFHHYLLNKAVVSIYVDSKGIVWAGGQWGENLYRYDRSSDQFIPFIDPNSGATINNVLHMMEDDKKIFGCTHLI